MCNPSRCALLSGLRPFTTDVYESNADGRTVIPSLRPLLVNPQAAWDRPAAITSYLQNNHAIRVESRHA